MQLALNELERGRRHANTSTPQQYRRSNSAATISGSLSQPQKGAGIIRFRSEGCLNLDQSQDDDLTEEPQTALNGSWGLSKLGGGGGRLSLVKRNATPLATRLQGHLHSAQLRFDDNGNVVAAPVLRAGEVFKLQLRKRTQSSFFEPAVSPNTLNPAQDASINTPKSSTPKTYASKQRSFGAKDVAADNNRTTLIPIAVAAIASKRATMHENANVAAASADVDSRTERSTAGKDAGAGIDARAGDETFKDNCADADEFGDLEDAEDQMNPDAATYFVPERQHLQSDATASNSSTTSVLPPQSPTKSARDFPPAAVCNNAVELKGCEGDGLVMLVGDSKKAASANGTRGATKIATTDQTALSSSIRNNVPEEAKCTAKVLPSVPANTLDNCTVRGGPLSMPAAEADAGGTKQKQLLRSCLPHPSTIARSVATFKKGLRRRVRKSNTHDARIAEGLAVATEPETESVLLKYVVIPEGRDRLYAHIFNLRASYTDSEGNTLIGFNEALQALRFLHGDHITDAEMHYALVMIQGMQTQCSAKDVATISDRKLKYAHFAILAALSAKVVGLEESVKKTVNEMNLDALRGKVALAKDLFDLCGPSEDGIVPMSALEISFRAGRMNPVAVKNTLRLITAEDQENLTFLEFLAHTPLFVAIHDAIVENPVEEDAQPMSNMPAIAAAKRMGWQWRRAAAFPKIAPTGAVNARAGARDEIVLPKDAKPTSPTFSEKSSMLPALPLIVPGSTIPHGRPICNRLQEDPVPSDCTDCWLCGSLVETFLREKMVLVSREFGEEFFQLTVPPCTAKDTCSTLHGCALSVHVRTIKADTPRRMMSMTLGWTRVRQNLGRGPMFAAIVLSEALAKSGFILRFMPSKRQLSIMHRFPK